MRKELKLIYWVLFVLYIILLIKLLFVQGPLSNISHMFSNVSFDNMFDHFKTGQYMPFKTIVYHYRHSTIEHAVKVSLHIAIWLVPLGFFLPSLTSRKKMSHMIIIGLLVGIGIEVIELIMTVGFLNIDDIILCSMGTIIGFMLYKVMK